MKRHSEQRVGWLYFLEDQCLMSHQKVIMNVKCRNFQTLQRKTDFDIR